MSDQGIDEGLTERKFELAELVEQITPKNGHGEMDWGRPEGEEAW